VEELVDETAEMVMRYLRPDAPAHDRDEDDDELPARAPVTELHPLPS
jgi:hypothetical protein